MAKFEGIKTLKKYGHSYIVIVDKETRDSLSLEPGDRIYVTIEKKYSATKKA